MPAPNLVKEVAHENAESHPVVQHLQREVANAFVLYANYKHYHWHTYGPLFRDLHLLLDDCAKHALDSIDEMAERIRMIGPDVQSVQLKDYQHNAGIESARPGQSMREMIEQADANLLVVIKGMREAAKVADDSGDPGTVDMFSKIVRDHEHDEWFLREVLKKKDALVV